MRKPLKPGLPVRLTSLILVFGIFLAMQSTPAAEASHFLSPTVRLAVPIDADSPAVWSKAIAGAPSVGIIILNLANGPGQEVEATYARLVGEAQAHGISVLGYVYTRWADGNVSIQQAEAWIDHYYSWYHVDGIMLDEANNTCDAVPLHFYETLYNYVKAEPGPTTVMLNPGVATGECYGAISDVLLTFENDYLAYAVGYVSSSWTAGFPASHFFHVVFDVPTVADMQSAVSTAVLRGAGWVYVTNLNDSNGNPYSTLPGYFGQELAYVELLHHQVHANQTTMPIALILGLTAAGSAVVLVRGKKTAK